MNQYYWKICYARNFRHKKFITILAKFYLMYVISNYYIYTYNLTYNIIYNLISIYKCTYYITYKGCQKGWFYSQDRPVFFFGTPIRIYKCIYKGLNRPVYLHLYVVYRPVHPMGPAAVHIYVHYMGRPDKTWLRPRSGWCSPAVADRR